MEETLCAPSVIVVEIRVKIFATCVCVFNDQNKVWSTGVSVGFPWGVCGTLEGRQGGNDVLHSPFYL